jgi:hypothetical protein
MAEDNSRGYHKPHQVNMERGGSGSSGGPPGGGGTRGSGKGEPTNHAGHTHEMSKRHDSDRRIDSMRNAHAGHGQQDHEKILHDSHKLHQGGNAASHGTKHGADHHWRGNGE